jgi:hypothetical protein
MFEIDSSMQNFCNYKHSLQKERTVMPLMRKRECILPPMHAHQNTQTFLKVTVFWKVTSCSLVYHYRCPREPVASIFRVNVEATSSSKTLETIPDYMAVTTHKIIIFITLPWEPQISHFPHVFTDGIIVHISLNMASPYICAIFA